MICVIPLFDYSYLMANNYLLQNVIYFYLFFFVIEAMALVLPIFPLTWATAKLFSAYNSSPL